MAPNRPIAPRQMRMRRVPATRPLVTSLVRRRRSARGPLIYASSIDVCGRAGRAENSLKSGPGVGAAGVTAARIAAARVEVDTGVGTAGVGGSSRGVFVDRRHAGVREVDHAAAIAPDAAVIIAGARPAHEIRGARLSDLALAGPGAGDGVEDRLALAAELTAVEARRTIVPAVALV